MNNEISAFNPARCPEFPKTWNAWHEPTTADRLKKMPLKLTYTVDIVNYAENPSPFQPKSTKQLMHYSIYLISPQKIIIAMRSEGRDFMFADRFVVENIYFME